MTQKDITSKKFEKATFGYKPEEVDEYLRDLAIAYAKVVKEKEENEAKIVKLVEKINEYRSDEDAIRDALLVAQKQGNRIIAEAKAEGEKIVAEAQTKRDALLAEISNDCEALKKQEVEKVALAIKEENDKLNAITAASRTQIEMQTDKLNKLKAEVTQFKKNLISLLTEQTKLVVSLPELTDEQITEILNTKPEEAPAEPVVPETPAAEEPKEVAEKKTERKPNTERSFGFSEYRRQKYTTEELKFGNNTHKN